MLNAFLKDKSSFKKFIFIMSIMSVVLIISTGIIFEYFIALTQSNTKEIAVYKAQEEWLKKFDYNAAKELENTILTPVNAARLDTVQQEQLDMFSKNGLKLVSVRNKQKNNKNKAKSITTEVIVEGSWENMIAALNEFEKKNLVVITDLSLASDKKNNIQGHLKYNIYYK